MKLNLFSIATAMLAVMTGVGIPAGAQEDNRDEYRPGGSEAYYLRLSGSEHHSADFHVNFRWDNAVIRPEYMNTGENLKALADSIASISIGGGTLDSLTVVSYSSPEGNWWYNVNLSKRRAAAMRRHLEGEYPELHDRMSVTPDGEAGHMFRQRAMTDTTITEAQRVKLLSIIDSDNDYETKKQLIKDWDGALWNRIVRVWFKEMRRSFIRLDWTENIYTPVYFLEQPRRLSGAAVAPEMRLIPPPGESSAERTIVALKTNLLYDILTGLNAEIELPIGEQFSIMVEDVFPWWNFGPNGNKYCLQMWEMGVEPRWWFRRNDRRDRLSGHFVGVYGMSARYDFQWDRDVNYQGEYWSAGLSYGYAMPIGRLFNLELSASVGFVRTDYRHYQPAEDYSELYRDPFNTGVLSYFGPTKLKVSLVLPIKVKYRSR